MPFGGALTIGALGAASGAGSGKKGKNAAKQQVALGRDVLNFGKQAFNTGMGAWTPATDYWKTILSGDRTAVEGAIGPISDQVRSVGAATGRNIASSMPAGGERNLALELNSGNTYNNLARLYAGAQPTAASALAQLAGIPMGFGTSMIGTGTGAQSAGYGMLGNQALEGMQGAYGFGNLAYRLANKNRTSGGGKSGGGVNVNNDAGLIWPY